MKHILPLAIILLAFSGLADSAYVVQSELGGVSFVCSTAAVGCANVSQSAYMHVLGVPLAEWGVLFYTLLLTLAALEWLLHLKVLRRFIQSFGLVGGLISLCFLLSELFFIPGSCVYCIVSAGITLLILLCAWFLEPARRTVQPPQAIPSPRFTMPPRP